MLLTKILLSVVVFFGALLAPACDGGPLSKLDSTLDYAPLFFRGLAISGAISNPQADSYIAGVRHFEQVADETKSCLSDDVKTDVQCYAELGTNTRSVIAQFYPAVNEGKAGEYVALVQDVVALIIRKNTPQVGVGTSPVDLDEALENKIDQLDRLLKSEQR
jgi:hypothetical protein